MPLLSDDARAEIDRHMLSRQPPVGAKAANRARVLARLAQGDVPPEAVDAGAVKSIASWPWVAVAAAAAAVALAMVIAPAASTAIETEARVDAQAADPVVDRESNGAVEPSRPEPEPEPEPEPDSDPDSDPDPDPGVAQQAPRIRRRAPPRTAPPAPETSLDPAPSSVAPAPPEVSSPDRLAAEVALIRRARSLATRSDDRAALRLFMQHAAEFPDGALQEERLAWIAILRCRSGSREQGAAAASQLLRTFPRTPHARRVREACARATPVTDRDAPRE